MEQKVLDSKLAELKSVLNLKLIRTTQMMYQHVSLTLFMKNMCLKWKKI